MTKLFALIPAGSDVRVPWDGDGETFDLTRIGLPGLPDSSRSPHVEVALALLTDGGWDVTLPFALTDEDGAVVFRDTIANAAGLTPEDMHTYKGRQW